MADEKAPAKKEVAVKTLKDVYQVYTDKAAKSPTGEFEFSLLETYDVEFTSDFKNIKKGYKMNGISKVAFDLYNANGVVDLINKNEAPKEEEEN
ncbi:hypothetical protein OX284_014230 [Flavobacterium sp. SUN046]|uniref:hypothetical protein n=1 Tax=Flavobacterium sp. SUN046 TaxID=3002440 RepID=UPI002DBC3AF9|nr:hypothetical protein [Flavobacterium sp. SUN046]MEC4050593.1 hypothetical protein [Flavobacterium sp. SUN046]